MSDPVETWKAVPGHEGRYEVSDLGRVRSLDRVVERRLGRKGSENVICRVPTKGRVLRPGRAANGYLTVSLGGRSFCVHDLVLRAFVGPPPAGMEACHEDGHRPNVALSNLRWDTRKANIADQDRHGTKAVGTKKPWAKLTEETVRQVRSLKGKHSQSKLAKMFGVSPSAIQSVHDGRTWKHV